MTSSPGGEEPALSLLKDLEPARVWGMTGHPRNSLTGYRAQSRLCLYRPTGRSVEAIFKYPRQAPVPSIYGRSAGINT